MRTWLTILAACSAAAVLMALDDTSLATSRKERPTEEARSYWKQAANASRVANANRPRTYEGNFFPVTGAFAPR